MWYVEVKTCDAAISFFFGQSQKGPGKFSILRKVTSCPHTLGTFAQSTKNVHLNSSGISKTISNKSDFICENYNT